MKEAGTQWVEGDGWFGQADTGISTVASAEEDSDGNVMLLAATTADYEGEDAILDKQLRLHLSPIDALAYAERIRFAAVGALHALANGDAEAELTP